MFNITKQPTTFHVKVDAVQILIYYFKKRKI